MEVINSLGNNYVKKICSLKKKKYRDSEGCFFATGEKFVKDLIVANLPGCSDAHHIVDAVIVEDGYLGKYLSQTRLAGQLKKLIAAGLVKCFSSQVMGKLSDDKSAQHIAAVLKKSFFVQAAAKRFAVSENILGLCEIQDPRNLGAIMRTAAATGTGLLLSNDSCDVFSDKVIRTSAGLFDRVGFVQATSREDFLNRLKDRRVFAAALNEGMIYTNLNGMKNTCILMGNEGRGLYEDDFNIATDKVFIPMENDVDSLNVGVAASLFMFELNRKELINEGRA